MAAAILGGSCLCGAVRFTVEGELKGPDACHCTQCRKVSGHYWASTDVPKAALSIEGADRLSWFQSSEKVRRGFCSVCGSALFWDPVAHPFIGVAYTGSKGDYYDIADDVPQYETVPPRP
jgi:hypothetical protein